MLYNTQWKNPERNIFSLASFEAWLDTKDPNEKFNYMDQRNCCHAQYFRDMGMDFDRISSTTILHDRTETNFTNLPHSFIMALATNNTTFGGVREDCRRMRSDLVFVIEMAHRLNLTMVTLRLWHIGHPIAESLKDFDIASFRMELDMPMYTEAAIAA